MRKLGHSATVIVTPAAAIVLALGVAVAAWYFAPAFGLDQAFWAPGAFFIALPLFAKLGGTLIWATRPRKG